jgi:hypothetical protein
MKGLVSPLQRRAFSPRVLAAEHFLLSHSLVTGRVTVPNRPALSHLPIKRAFTSRKLPWPGIPRCKHHNAAIPSSHLNSCPPHQIPLFSNGLDFSPCSTFVEFPLEGSGADALTNRGCSTPARRLYTPKIRASRRTTRAGNALEERFSKRLALDWLQSAKEPRIPFKVLPRSCNASQTEYTPRPEGVSTLQSELSVNSY